MQLNAREKYKLTPVAPILQPQHYSMSFSDYVAESFGSNYEDKARYESEWLPKVIAYREKLAAGIKDEYKIKLPKTIEQLAEEKFNPLKFLYEEKLLTPSELELTDKSAKDLLADIANGKVTSVQVFKAFAKRATIAHQLTNCAMELFIDEGLARAEYLDKYLKENGKTVGPLHGLPMSLKEHNSYRGKVTHASYVGLVDNVTSEHSVTVQGLEDAGCIFYIRTSQPQTLMHLCSNNNYTGLTRNPHNLLLSSGGSSSGEGALVSFGGSAIGLGSDIGGSIRAPAAYSGCQGFRPTQKRLSIKGGISAGSGQESVLGVVGPLARTVDDIDLWMDASLNFAKPWLKDAMLVPQPWRKVEAPSPANLTVGVMYDDGLVRPTPPIRRGLKHAVSKLEAAGVKVVEFKPIRTKDAYEAVTTMYNCDGNSRQFELLNASGEPLKKLTRWNLNFGQGDKPLTVKENRQLNIVRDLLRQEYTEFLLNNKIDVILSPNYNNVAPITEGVYNWSYTALFNILDFPSLTLQTGLYQDPEIDVWEEADKAYEYRSGVDELEQKSYDPSKFVGAPIAVQLSGRRYFDEDVVAAGKTVEKILGADLFKQYQ